jgi:pantoate--beta-alanine ligase
VRDLIVLEQACQFGVRRSPRPIHLQLAHALGAHRAVRISFVSGQILKHLEHARDGSKGAVRVVSIVQTISDLRAAVAGRRGAGPIGFVPTMGALHAGHASLIEHARRECATVVASIFVNPLQFDRPEDLERYPRTLETDVALCRSLGVDLVFAPGVAEMYPRPLECRVAVGKLADHLCGRYRPGHFAGVATVVLKLFEIVQADLAYFGEKDAQQLAIIRRLVADFNLPVRVVGVPTVREPDGLALSSRNQRLDATERTLAPALHRALLRVRHGIETGLTDSGTLTQAGEKEIPIDPRLKLEYLEIVDPDDFQPVREVRGRVVAAGALWVGTTRLIDNVTCTPERSR